MLLGDADRELLYEALKRHHAEGRVDLADLERRGVIVAEAQTREAAAEAMAGLPPLSVPAPEARRPRWGRGHGEAFTALADEEGWTLEERSFSGETVFIATGERVKPV